MACTVLGPLERSRSNPFVITGKLRPMEAQGPTCPTQLPGPGGTTSYLQPGDFQGLGPVPRVGAGLGQDLHP